MKTNYIKTLFLATFFIGVSAEINAQDDLKKSKYGSQIKQHLKMNDLTVLRFIKVIT